MASGKIAKFQDLKHPRFQFHNVDPVAIINKERPDNKQFSVNKEKVIILQAVSNP